MRESDALEQLASEIILIPEDDPEGNLMTEGDVECCSECGWWFACEDIVDSDNIVCCECAE